MFIMKKKFFAILFIACILLSSVLVPSAYDWPASPTNNFYVVSGLSSHSVQKLANLSDLMAEMNMIPQPYYPIAIVTGGVYSSSSSSFQEYHLYVSRVPLVASVSGSTISYTTSSSVPQGVPIFRYYFTETGWCLYVQSGFPVSFSSDRLVYSFVDVPDSTPWRGLNPSISFGSNNDSVINNLYQEYVDLFNVVDNYEETLLEVESIAYETGYVQGSADAYPEAYRDGYSDGLGDGYETGYSSGFSAGQEYGEEIGYDEGYQEGFEGGVYHGQAQGYETGYAEGRTIGYNQGYAEGNRQGLTVGRQEGYDLGFPDGYETGFDDGYESGYSDGLSSGGGSGENPIAFTVKYANASLEAAGVILYLYWDGSDLSTLVWKEASDFPGGYVFYTTTEYFLPSQIEAPSSIKIAIPSVILDRWPEFNLGFVTIDQKVTFYNATCFLYIDSYDAGYIKGLNDNDAILKGISDIAAAPITGLRQALDFEIFGLNVSLVVVGLIAVSLAWIAWKLFKKFIPV